MRCIERKKRGARFLSAGSFDDPAARAFITFSFFFSDVHFRVALFLFFSFSESSSVANLFLSPILYLCIRLIYVILRLCILKESSSSLFFWLVNKWIAADPDPLTADDDPTRHGNKKYKKKIF